MRLEAVADFKVLIMGDAIYDRYRFCEPLGRATKEAVMSVRVTQEEEYRGGVWAAAEHIKDLCAVDVWHGSHAVVNTKYIGRYSQKLFSVHETREITGGAIREIKDYDVVICFDYGHGFFRKEFREFITGEARFLAVNAQTNSSNYGFNRINETWPVADLVVVDDIEARLAAHEPELPMEEVIRKLNYNKIIVTMGSKGSIGYSEMAFFHEKALTDRPVDLLGAGDAVLAVVAPFAAAGVSMQELIHLGNVAGAIKVGILGHQTHITKKLLEKHL